MTPPAAPAPTAALPDMPAKLAFLAAQGGPGAALECIETHMSWVFLSGDRVLKMKKPMRSAVLDFSSLQAREFNCREELRLNARLAPDVYLGLLALQWDGRHFTLLPEQEVQDTSLTVDWLVLMRRLPTHRLLDHAIAERQVGPPDIDALGSVLVPFYRHAPVARITPRDYLARFERELAADRALLLEPRWQLADAAPALAHMAEALVHGAGPLQARVTQRRIVEGHGDLRPEHVCLLRPPVVIDCLEFNARLRQVDPFEEIAFLALECDMAGAPWIGPQLLHQCALGLGDPPAAPVMHIYTAHRALLRARQAMAHLLDPVPRNPAKWQPLAQHYIAQAGAALRQFDAALSRARRRETP